MSRRRATPARRWMWVGSVVVLLLGITAAGVVWQSPRGSVGETVVRTSSTALGYSARDVVTSGSAESPGPAWQSDGETTGAWVELSWQRPHTLEQIVLVRPVGQPGATEGFVTFGDGSYLQVVLSRTSPETVVPFTPRQVDRLRFTASAVDDGARNVSIAEIVVATGSSEVGVVVDDAPDGNAARSATVTQSDGVGSADPLALRDGSGDLGAGGASAGWSVDRPAGAWVQLDWDAPRELSSIQVVGSAASAVNLSSATITFDDGALMPVGAVLSQPERPTTISFMPRVVTSVRLTVDSVEGAGTLTLGELRAYQRGATPARPSSSVAPGPPPRTEGACPAPTAGVEELGLVVLCPPSGTTVDGLVDFRVLAAPGYSTVTATVWPADIDVYPVTPVSKNTDAAGMAALSVDVSGLSPGPLTVEFAATGAGLETYAVHFQIYLSGATVAEPLPSSAPAAGRTLAYAEEFDRPLSLSRTGSDTDYTAAKPTSAGVEDFGDAIFPDPALGLGNVRVVDERYLRIDAEPRPLGYDDPQGYDRDFIGGMLASARSGGSGVSAQYGYFETRMLMPAAPGTWPAFWMLPSDNLIEPTEFVAEIDAVEHYGHNPTGACHVTHEYITAGGRDGEGYCGERFSTVREALTWHTYGVSITPTENIFYIDGQVVATSTQVRGGEAPMFFMVNLALGGGWPVELGAVQNRATLYVDYVRVYV